MLALGAHHTQGFLQEAPLVLHCGRTCRHYDVPLHRLYYRMQMSKVTSLRPAGIHRSGAACSVRLSSLWPSVQSLIPTDLYSRGYTPKSRLHLIETILRTFRFVVRAPLASPKPQLLTKALLTLKYAAQLTALPGSRETRHFTTSSSNASSASAPSVLPRSLLL